VETPAPFPRGFRALPFLDGVWLRLFLALMVLIASVSLLTGTAATLNSTSVNPGSSFEAGDLILSNRDRQPEPCLSHGPEISCEAFFPGLTEPGVLDKTTVVLTNLGTLPVGKLLLWSSACADSATGAGHGTGSLCQHTWLYIHDDDHDRCEFPVEAPGACPLDVHRTYADFAAAHPQTSPISLSPDHLGGGDNYTVEAEIDPVVGNDFQNLKAELTFTWEIIQG
jgi:hypothetical protein